MAVNVKQLLYLFEDMAGLKINFEKSEIMMVIEDSIKLEAYGEILSCQMESWSMKYLRAPVSGSRLHIKELKFIEERSLKHLDGWQGGPMSLARRKMLIDSSLNGIYTYFMFMFRLQ